MYISYMYRGGFYYTERQQTKNNYLTNTWKEIERQMKKRRTRRIGIYRKGTLIN